MESKSSKSQNERRAVKPLQLMAMAVLLAVAFGSNATVRANSQSELDAVRAATAKFQSVEAAMQAGYEPFMECFDNPGVGAMGYHYLKGSLLDLTVEELTPEAMVYEADANGGLTLVAVEYIIPAKEWDAQNTEMATLFGQKFHLNEKLGVYVLHAWIGKENPRGVYDDWNPTVSCRYMPAGAVGMPRTGSGATLPIGMAALTVTLLSIGVLMRQRSLRTE